jgi:hypothetical protein
MTCLLSLVEARGKQTKTKTTKIMKDKGGLYGDGKGRKERGGIRKSNRRHEYNQNTFHASMEI